MPNALAISVAGIVGSVFHSVTSWATQAGVR